MIMIVIIIMMIIMNITIIISYYIIYDLCRGAAASRDRASRRAGAL